MPITYPLNLPFNNYHYSIKIMRLSNVATTSSRFNFTQQTQVFPGQQWAAEITLPRMNKADVEEWNSFFGKLNGKEGSFLMGDPHGATPRGSAKDTPGTPVVFGASQTGNELNIDGCTISATGYLLKGDYFQLGSGSTARLHKLLDDVNTDGGGAATLLFWPSLRESPGDNDAITLTSPKTTWKLASNETSWDAERGLIYQVDFPLVVENI